MTTASQPETTDPGEPIPAPGPVIRSIEGGVRGLGLLSSIGVAMLMIHVVADVALRFWFNSPIHGTIEYVQYWYMIVIAYMAFGLTQQREEHIDAPVLAGRLSQRIQDQFAQVGRVLTLALLAIIAWTGWQEALKSMGMSEKGGAAGVIIWPTRFLVPLGALVFALQVITDMRRPAAADDTKGVL